MILRSSHSPDPRRSTGKVVHLDWELLQMVDTCIQLGHQHEEVRSLVKIMFCFDNAKFVLITLLVCESAEDDASLNDKG